MGRAPCCDKNNVKKGPWSPEEDAKLKAYIEEHGTGGNWIALPQKIGLKRCGKSCRLRWLNYLRPNIKHGGFSEEEDNIICSLFISIGSRWSIIAAQLPGRTDNDIKNYWNTRLKKKLFGKQRREHGLKAGNVSRHKQAEMRKAAAAASRENPMMMMMAAPLGNTNNTPSWPELPVLDPIRYAAADNEPGFNDHQSIRNLLIKLGGKFGENEDVIKHKNLAAYPMENLPPPPPLYQQSPMNQLSSAPTTETLNATSSPFSISEYNMEAEFRSFPGENCFPEQMVYTDHSNNIPQKLDGLEFLYDNMFNNNGKLGSSSSGGSMDWGEMMSYCSLAFAPTVSSYTSTHVLQPATGLSAAQPHSAALFEEELISYSGTPPQ